MERSKGCPHPHDIQGTQKGTNGGQAEGEKSKRKAAGQGRKCVKMTKTCNEKSPH